MNEQDAREQASQSVKDGGSPTQDQFLKADQKDNKHKTSDTLLVSWNPPEPRPGALGGWDRFVGPGATNAEEVLQLVLGGVIAIGGLILFWLAQGQTASLWQLLFVAVLAFDIGGGIVTNSTSAAKRWYHRYGHGRLQHIGFVAAHLVHIGLMAFLFADDPISYALALGGMLMVSTVTLLFTPLYLQRPMAVGLAMAIIMAGQLPLFDIAGLNWFIPALMLKLILGHALKEAPFQPGDD